MNLESILSPIEIGPVTIKNRFVVPPMSNNFALPSGSLSSRSYDYYVERAKGGFGLITIEATVVDKTAKGGIRKHCLYDDSMIEGLKKVVVGCHEYGAKVSIQLQQAGPEGNAKAAGYPLKSASPIVAAAGKDVPLEMSTKQIYELIDIYGDAAFRAKQAGIDVIEIHLAHGYLISSFISPQTNKRLDEFGGSFLNRMRLPRLIIEEIKKRVGPDLAISCRLNSSDETLGGLTIEDSKLIARYLESIGVDVINLSRSIHLRDEYMWAPSPIHQGFNLEHARQIKESVNIPVIMVGRFNDPFLADQLIYEGHCDLVAFGRQSIADPWLPNKTRDGLFEEQVPCIACLQGCVGNMFVGQPITCLANPFVGYEAQLDFKMATTPKKVMIVGAGVAGLYSAWILAARGHQVTIHEATNELGGQMRLAAFPPGKGDITTLIRSYLVLCNKYGVEIKLNSKVTEEVVINEKPDALVLATGAKPLVPPIPGIDKTVHAIDVLAGKVACGKKILVVGGGLVGSETADYLGERNFDVTILEQKDKIAGDISGEHRIYMMENYQRNGVKMITNATVKSFVDSGVIYTKDNQEINLTGFDTVILALGGEAYNPLETQLSNIIKEMYVIGDGLKARKALEAINEAKNIAISI